MGCKYGTQRASCTLYVFHLFIQQCKKGAFPLCSCSGIILQLEWYSIQWIRRSFREPTIRCIEPKQIIMPFGMTVRHLLEPTKICIKLENWWRIDFISSKGIAITYTIHIWCYPRFTPWIIHSVRTNSNIRRQYESLNCTTLLRLILSHSFRVSKALS